MSLEQNKDVARRFIDEVVNKQRTELADELTDAGYFLFFPGPPWPISRNELPAFLAELHGAFRDFHVQIDEAIAEGESVAMAVTITGTHKGVYQGLRATGESIKLTGAVFFRFRDGKIFEDRPFFDQMTLLKQLGVWGEGPMS